MVLLLMFSIMLKLTQISMEANEAWKACWPKIGILSSSTYRIRLCRFKYIPNSMELHSSP